MDTGNVTILKFYKKYLPNFQIELLALFSLHNNYMLNIFTLLSYEILRILDIKSFI